MRRDDPRAHAMPVGHIPAGSGNAIAKSLSDLAGATSLQRPRHEEAEAGRPQVLVLLASASGRGAE
jgi:hypothetical protein